MQTTTLPAKLQTYLGPTASNLGVKCHPVNGGGATVDLSSDTLDYAKHTTGYYVGGVMTNILIPAHSRPSVYGRALADIYNATGGEGFAGFWHNGQDVEAEASEWIEDRGEAVSLAQRRGERAIYDVAARESIML